MSGVVMSWGVIALRAMGCWAIALGCVGAAMAGELFVDRTAAAGLDFVHENGMSGQLYMPENLSAGGALLDVDGDGDLDLYLLQGAPLGPGRPPAATDRLYRNDSGDNDRGGEVRFTDITALAGLAPAAGYRMGAAVGDVDGDGRLDLYLTAFGRNRLLRRRAADGPFFEDTTEAAGAGDERWSVPAVFFDLDGDGHLDLFVGNYLDFSFAGHRPCTTPGGAPDYCDPAVYGGVPDRLLRNRGDGTFEDVTARAGLGGASGKALGAVAADFDDDGDLDLYVANDRVANHLWLNQGDGTFRDEAYFAGCAVNGEGHAEASMGVDAEDYDGDGDLDLFLTHFTGETHTLYRNDGEGLFTDVTAQAGLAAPSLAATGFGTGFVDADLDGRLDLLAVNGAVRAIEAQRQAGMAHPLRQPDQLFLAGPGGRFREARVAALEGPEVSRGALFGDLDDDGDVDLVITRNHGPAQLLLGTAAAGSSWLGVELRDAAGRPVAAARVALEAPGRPALYRRAGRDGSYASASDPRIVFGLGAAPLAAADVQVIWSDGTVELFPAVPTGRYSELRRGGGRQP